MNTDDDQTTSSKSSSHYTRSKALTQFKFAGVLPFCILQNGETHVLLGAEPVRTGPSGCIWKTMCKPLVLRTCLKRCCIGRLVILQHPLSTAYALWHQMHETPIHKR